MKNPPFFTSNSDLAGKYGRRRITRRRGKRKQKFLTHTDRPRASLIYGEEREINRNEEAFWGRNSQMVKCEEEKNEENGERGGGRRR